MIDIKLLRANPEQYKKTAQIKKVDVDIDELLRVDQQRSKLLLEIETLRKERNEIDAKVKRGANNQRAALIDTAKEIKKQLGATEPELKKVEARYHDLLGRVPLPADPSTPIGDDDRANREVARHGEPPHFSFTPQGHIALGKKLDLLDLEAGVKISGFRGYVLKNEGVLLQMAVLWHALQKLRQNGFQLTIPPTLVKEFALVGSGHFPFDRANVYSVVEPGVPKKSPKSESLYLVGTSEPALLALYAREVLREENLPVKLCGFSPCYRSEIGSYGRDTKGIYRIHEFWKVEQVILCRNDIQESLHWLEELRSISEEILQDLELPYRVVQNCTGDMGPGKYKMYDLETWMPSRQGYGETHSDSALLDWQARRLNIKYRDRAGKTQFAHTLNNTGIASPRILIALLENNQLSDGRVKVPKVLQPYLGQKVITPK